MHVQHSHACMLTYYIYKSRYMNKHQPTLIDYYFRLTMVIVSSAAATAALVVDPADQIAPP